jgi:anti-anti-sigma regulatory factor
LRSRLTSARYVVSLEGQIDGSTACRALSALAHAPTSTREIVLDLSGLTAVEAFGLEVLARGLRTAARERRLSIRARPDCLHVAASLAQSLRGDDVS